MVKENHYAFVLLLLSILDKQLMAFINNDRVVEGLTKWICTASLITVVFVQGLFVKKDQSILPNS